MRDYYAILGVDRQASPDEVKTAFRKLAMNYHPDRNPGDTWAERRFKEVNEAYETLGDEALRAQYDVSAEIADEGAADRPVSEGADWSEPLDASGERFWRETDPADGPPDTPPSSPWFKVSIAGASLVLAGLAVFLLVLPPSGPRFEKISNQPLGATEPAIEEKTTALPPELPASPAPTILNERAAAPMPEETLPVTEPSEPDPIDADWTRARDSKDLPTLARFIQEHPETERGKEALATFADLVEAEDREPPLEVLLREFPTGAVAERARTRLESLRRRAASAEEDAWIAAERQGSAADFRTFIEQYPSARRVDDAKARLEGLGLIEVAVGMGAESRKRWLRAIDTFRDCPTCPPMVVARARKTAPPDFDAKVRAALPEPYAIAKSRISAREWAECAREKVCATEPESATALFGLSWSDGQRYANWLRRKTGKNYRLVTELEWRYAMRLKLVAVEPADGALAYPGRTRSPDASPLGSNSPAEDRPVERATPRSGERAYEWVSDCWSEGATDGAGVPGAEGGVCAERVLLARRGREFERFGDRPASGQAGYTFRVARSLE